MQQMLKLLADNRKRGFFSAAVTDEEATLYLYDVIVSSDAEAEFWGGVSPQAFIQELQTITAPVVHLRINSPGGDVFGARAMEQALREHESKIVVHIDGLAASAASFLAMAADEIEINKGGFFMIHKAWTVAIGNADDLLSTAALLEKIDESLAQTYVDRTDQDADQVRAWMAAETWFSGEEAVELGFADRVAEGTAKNESAWNLAAYGNAPDLPMEQPEQPPEAPAAPAWDTDALSRRLRMVERAA